MTAPIVQLSLLFLPIGILSRGSVYLSGRMTAKRRLVFLCPLSSVDRLVSTQILRTSAPEPISKGLFFRCEWLIFSRQVPL